MGFPLTLMGVFYTAKVLLDFLYVYNCIGKKSRINHLERLMSKEIK